MHMRLAYGYTYLFLLCLALFGLLRTIEYVGSKYVILC